MVNLHITITPFCNSSRILKETSSLIRAGLVKRIFITALHENGLHEFEDIDATRTVWRVKLKSRTWPRVIIVQLLKYFEYCWKVNAYARKHKVQIVNVHKLGLLPIGAWLKYRLGAKLVYDAHELETEINGAKGLRKALLKIIENVLIDFVDLTIVVGWKIEKWYRNKYHINNIVTVLNCPFYCDGKKTRLLRDEFNIPDHKKIVIYQGGLSAGRGLELLIKAFQNNDDDCYVIIFMGYGELEKLVKKEASLFPRIYYKSAVHPSEIIQYTASADIGISAIENTCLSYHYCLPNKLFEYVMARIPVVVSNLPEMSRVVKGYDIGVVLHKWETSSILKALHRINEMNSVHLNNNLNIAAKKFSWQIQEEAMISAYRKYILNN
jgi:glycosyltransferase involved in cell wall biosynthesis